jgi:hypothetical protein
MTPNRRISWNAQDNEQLKAMVLSGTSPLRTAAVFKCTMSAVRMQARKLGTPFPSTAEARKKLALDADATWNSHWSQPRKACKRPRPGATE